MGAPLLCHLVHRPGGPLCSDSQHLALEHACHPRHASGPFVASPTCAHPASSAGSRAIPVHGSLLDVSSGRPATHSLCCPPSLLWPGFEGHHIVIKVRPVPLSMASGAPSCAEATLCPSIGGWMFGLSLGRGCVDVSV